MRTLEVLHDLCIVLLEICGVPLLLRVSQALIKGRLCTLQTHFRGVRMRGRTAACSHDRKHEGPNEQPGSFPVGRYTSTYDFNLFRSTSDKATVLTGASPRA